MKKRSIAFLLSLVMLLSLLTPTALAEEPEQEAQATEERTEIPALSAAEVAVPREAAFGDETTVTAPAGAESYQWQFRLMEDLWVNISGDESAAIVLTYAKVCNMLDESGAASLRCLVDGAASETLTVTVTDEPAQEPDETPVPDEEPVLDEEPVIQPVLPVLDPQQSAEDTIVGVSNGAVGVQEETGDETPAEDTQDTYSIVINYVLPDGTEAAPSYTAKVASGSSFKMTVPSPAVLGYTADREKVELNYDQVAENITVTVTYSPAQVNFTVEHYQQNVDNDNYTKADTESLKELTGNPVGEKLEKKYDGFSALLYNAKETVAADGSTVVKIYYNRNYYLMNFDLDGGYGVEPIYAKYGTALNVGIPEKAGYTFDTWYPKLEYDTMPAMNTSYKATWRTAGKVKVTIVYWGENANDTGYSYLNSKVIEADPGEEITMTESMAGSLTTLVSYGLPEDAAAVDPNDDGYGDRDARTHFEGNCTNPKDTGKLTNLVSGSVCHYKNGYKKYGSTRYEDFYWLYLDGKYYALTDTQYNKLKSNNGQSVIDGRDTYEIYSVNANAVRKLWEYVEAKPEAVKAAGDDSTVINVYYRRTEFTLTFKVKGTTVKTIKTKWGADIKSEFPIVGTNGKRYNGYWWEVPAGSITYEKGNYLLSIDAMPQENIEFSGTNMGTEAKLYYYVQKLPGENSAETDKTEGNYSFKLYKPVVYTAKSGWLTEKEEFYEIPGFTKYKSDPSFANGDPRPKDDNYFYYLRNSYQLKFYNRNAEVEQQEKTVLYEAALRDYNFTPDYPAKLERGAYLFAGWYTTPECYDNSRVDWDTIKMPANDLMLYAKWVPVTHTVRTFQSKDALSGEPLDTWTVSHGSTVPTPPEDPENGEYDFIGWFYMDGDEEKAFNFSMPVTRDLDLYAKWSSNKQLPYIIRYAIKNADGEIEIADQTTGSALAGTLQTFNAKTGTQLYEDYQSGYYPETNSHSITLNIDDPTQNEFTFYYVKKAEVNYRVEYRYADTGELVQEIDPNPKTDKTSNAVITAKFVTVKGYMPDSYQKRLILSANEEENVITFWYTKDEKHAPLQVIHWIQNIEGDQYTEYQSSNESGEIGQTYTRDALDIPGFTYNQNKGKSSGKLTEDGLVLEFFYDRNVYPYLFKFVNEKDEEIATSVSGKARYEATVGQRADKELQGYQLMAGEADYKSIKIAIEDPATSQNVRVFHYVEKTVDIKYEIKGPAGCGALSSYQDNGAKVFTGPVNGSTPTANDGFRFVGWFKDADCKLPVDESWVANNKLTPGKTKNYGTESEPKMGYEAATYYAKFEPDVADLTISKRGCANIDEHQSFIFTVTGEGLPDEGLKVVVTGNGSVTIKDLKVGTTYTITEDTGWSWRYTPTAEKQEHTMIAGENQNTVTFTNERPMDKWLNGCSWAENNWASGKKKTDKNPDGETN